MKRTFQIALLAAIPAISFAAEPTVPSAPSESSRNVDVPGQANADPLPGTARAEQLAKQYNVPEEMIMDMHQQSDMNWREIESTLQIAWHLVKNSDPHIPIEQAVDQVHDLRADGTSYESIARRYGLELGK